MKDKSTLKNGNDCDDADGIETNDGDDRDEEGSCISEKEGEEEMLEKVKFNLKKLVRLLHVSKPVDLVMGLIGKK